MYPEYVKKYRPKGSIVKLVNNQYYVYSAHSKRVPDKKYPVQVIDGLIGKIDEFGFHKATRKIIDISTVKIREYGFSNYLLLFKDLFVLDKNWGPKQNAIKIYKSLIVHFCNNSYLADEEYFDLDTLTEKYNICIANQIKLIQQMIGFSFTEIEPLKYLCFAYIDGKKVYGEITHEQLKLLDKLEIKIDDIQ